MIRGMATLDSKMADAAIDMPAHRATAQSAGILEWLSRCDS
jgi:hypothetical protein